MNYLYISRELGLPTPVLIIDCGNVSKMPKAKREIEFAGCMQASIKNKRQDVLRHYFGVMPGGKVGFGKYVEIDRNDFQLEIKECAVVCKSKDCQEWNSCMSPTLVGATVALPDAVSVHGPTIYPDWQERLFDHMAKEHGLVLLCTEMADIKACIVKEHYPQKF